MGRRNRRLGRGGPSPPPPPPPPPRPAPGASINELLRWLGHGGGILVLFETPSGFAVFNYHGVYLYRPKAMEILSDEELSKLVAEASKFEGKFVKYKCLGVYNAIVRANKVRFTALRTLRSLVKGERPENENEKYPKGV